MDGPARTQLRRTRRWGGPAAASLALATLVAVVGCGETAVVCAEGTSLDAKGVCVSTELLKARCGNGTVWDGTACILALVGLGGDAAATDSSPSPDAGSQPETTSAPDSGPSQDVSAAVDAGQDASPDAPCSPACAGKECGDDGCGGSCGECQFVSNKPICSEGLCIAIPSCTPDCANKTCGDNGCGGSCGGCGPVQACFANKCVTIEPKDSCVGHCGLSAPGGCLCNDDCGEVVECCADFFAACYFTCTPECTGKNCGDDGCGGSCGKCGVGQVCGAAGTCGDDPCQPDPCSGHGTCGKGGCSCNLGYSGLACNACIPGYVGYPTCVPSACQGQLCNTHGVCQEPTGACKCDPGFSGATCDACADVSQSYPACKATP